MTTKKRRLGRGLGSLIGNIDDIARASDANRSEGAIELDIDRIQRSKFQPRQVFDRQALQELSDSIRAHGIVQPIVVRPEGDYYELIAGERRWRAAQAVGLHKIPAVIRDIDEKSAAAIALIENIQREDLNPIEESQGLRRPNSLHFTSSVKSLTSRQRGGLHLIRVNCLRQSPVDNPRACAKPFC